MFLTIKYNQNFWRISNVLLSGEKASKSASKTETIVVSIWTFTRKKNKIEKIFSLTE